MPLDNKIVAERILETGYGRLRILARKSQTDRTLTRWAIFKSWMNARAFNSLTLAWKEGQDAKSKTYLQHLHKHFNNVSDGILSPIFVRIKYPPSNFGKNCKNDIFELKFWKHGKSMVIAKQALLPCRNCPEDFQMVLPFVSNHNNADDNIKSISCTRRSCKSILFS